MHAVGLGGTSAVVVVRWIIDSAWNCATRGALERAVGGKENKWPKWRKPGSLSRNFEIFPRCGRLGVSFSPSVDS
jgi:hypothetical protein